MVYTYIGKNTIKMLSFTKTLLGQYTLSHFAKTHSTDFIVDRKIQGVDLIASVIREALSSAQPQPITEKDICLVLPQDVCLYARYTVPSDMSDSAIIPFAQEKVRNELKIDLEATYQDYLIKRRGNEQVVMFFGLDKETYSPLQEAFSLLQLKTIRVIPEVLAYYTLFEKTLRSDKKETMLYVSYNTAYSSAFVYDSFGPAKGPTHYLPEDIKPALKALVTSLTTEGTKVNRLILSGDQSPTVRQDLFTKDVGAWTNPLEKIIDTFYKDYLKQIAPQENGGLSVLTYDVCFGAFVFSEMEKQFSLLKGSARTGIKASFPTMSVSMPGGGFLRDVFSLRTVGIFILSFGLTFGMIFGLSKLNLAHISVNIPQSAQPTVVETPTVPPTATPSPTPAIDRKEVKVKILNGSGTRGKANDVKEILQEAGYVDIVTGNAEAFDYEKTEIQIKEDATDLFSLMQGDIKDYVEISDAATLDDTETADIVLIIGSDFP